MKTKNGKKNIVTKGKNNIFAIFSVFVIFISIILNISYEYNNVITTHYKQYYADKEEFAQRIATIYNDYLSNGSTLDLSVFLSTILVSETVGQIDPLDLTDENIHTIIKCMNENPNVANYSRIIYDETAFRKNIKTNWLTKGKFAEVTKGYSDEALDSIVDDIYKQADIYNTLYGQDKINSASSGGACTYKVKNQNYSNVKVKLLNCEGNTYVDGEELVDFETYITGVVYQEVGNTETETMKAQAVAARSYALRRPDKMGGAFGIGFENSSEGTILSLRSCTLDQAFCNPDKGCWSNVAGGQTSSSSTYANCTIHSGEDKSKNWSRPALAENSEIRTAVQETYGQVAVDSSGNVVYTPYVSTNQNRWNSMAKQGKDYFEILKKEYPEIATIKSDCTSGANTELAKEALTWKQTDSRWGSQLIGSKTIAQVGCMVTATAIQIARSGTELKVSDFNPGVFVSTVKSNGGFSGNNFNVDASTWASIAPNFKVGGMVEFSASDSNTTKLNKMASLISQGYYVIARVYHPGQHWVAVTDVRNGQAAMADPGSNSTDLCKKYSCSTITRMYYFKAE